MGKSWHTPEYTNYISSIEWRNKSKFCQTLTHKHCIIFPWLKSRHGHHLTYKNMKSEIPIRDTVPLSVTGHNIIHLNIFWRNKKNRVWVNYFLRFCMVCSIIFWNTFGLLIRLLGGK